MQRTMLELLNQLDGFEASVGSSGQIHMAVVVKKWDPILGPILVGR